jgi:hypothetical protein
MKFLFNYYANSKEINNSIPFNDTKLKFCKVDQRETYKTIIIIHNDT